MLASNVKLYTWIDVQDVMLKARENNDWPEELIWVQTYWSGLFLGIRPGMQKTVMQWINEQFAPRLTVKRRKNVIQLEKGYLPVNCEEVEEIQRARTQLQKPSLLRDNATLRKFGFVPLPIIEKPEIIAFHSFSASQARSLYALALARSLTDKGKKVLLIDGDLEAPGLTYLFLSVLPQTEISYADLLALIHSDKDRTAKNAVQLSAERIRSQKKDGILLLPALRELSQQYRLGVKPEHITNFHANPYILPEVIAALGRKLKADVVIIDLHEGFSELSAGLLFDPRVRRLLISTLSGPSLMGTAQMLKKMSKEAPARFEKELPPAVIFDLPAHPDNQRLEAAKNALYAACFEDKQAGQKEELNFFAGSLPAGLTEAPLDWAQIMEALEKWENKALWQDLLKNMAAKSIPAQ